MRQMVSEFLDGAGNKPYRELIRYHIKKQSTAELRKAVLGESALLPDHLGSLVIAYIDLINEHFSYDRAFWRDSNCKEAFEQIIKVAIDFLPIKERIPTIQSAYKSENQDLAFQLFQIPTLSFAYSASTQKAQRKFMGIKKGIFG